MAIGDASQRRAGGIPAPLQGSEPCTERLDLLSRRALYGEAGNEHITGDLAIQCLMGKQEVRHESDNPRSSDVFAAGHRERRIETLPANLTASRGRPSPTRSTHEI